MLLRKQQIGSFIYNDQVCLGQGSYGRVFQGINNTTGEDVAIKKLDLQIFKDNKYLKKQIISEIEIMKKLKHANIVQIKDVLLSENSLYIILEMCNDGDLKQLISKKKLEEEEVIRIMEQVIIGCKEIVSNGIIHRDIKPANILNHNGTIKITDFGFAKYVDNYSHQLLNSFVGSPLYMAPQILEKKEYSTKCDIWSLGVIFYEMLFGVTPWVAKDEKQLLRKIQNQKLNLHNTQLSNFSLDFLKRSLVISEEDRMSWPDVFESFKSFQSIGITKQIVFINDDKEYQIEQEDAIQKVPQWMISPVQKQIQLTQLEVEKKITEFNEERNFLSFAHFVNVELYRNLDQKKEETAYIQFIVLLSRWVMQNSQNLIILVAQIFNQAEQQKICQLPKSELLNNINKNKITTISSNKSNQIRMQVMEKLQKEDEYYIQLFSDIRDNIEQTNRLTLLNQNQIKLYEEDYPSENMMIDILQNIIEVGNLITQQQIKEQLQIKQLVKELSERYGIKGKYGQ